MGCKERQTCQMRRSFIDLAKPGAGTGKRTDPFTVFPIFVRIKMGISRDAVMASLGRNLGGPQNPLHHGIQSGEVLAH